MEERRKTAREGWDLISTAVSAIATADGRYPGSPTAEETIARYPSVFGEGLGSLPGLVRLEIDHGVTPQKSPIRRVPIAVQDKVQTELNRLASCGVVTKVEEPTDWISSFVVAYKKTATPASVSIPRL